MFVTFGEWCQMTSTLIFFFFSAIPLPLISFLCFLSLSILLRFVSLSFAHSANLYFLVGMWIWFARQYIFIRRKFRIEPFIWMVEFSHDTHTHTNTNTVCWTAIFIQSTIWNAYFVACKWTLKWWWCCCHRLSPRGSPFTQSDKECDRLNACRLSARSRVFASVCVCVCVWKYMYMCAMRARAHPHSFHIKYASSSAVYLTSSAIKMLILHCIRLLAAYAFFYFSSRFFLYVCPLSRSFFRSLTLFLCFNFARRRIPHQHRVSMPMWCWTLELG